MTTPRKLTLALVTLAALAAVGYWLYLARPWSGDADGAEQPMWLLGSFGPAADEYLGGLDREQLLREFVISAESGFGGVIVREDDTSVQLTVGVPPLRVLRGVSLDSASGGGLNTPRPQSAYLTSALASGDDEAIALEAELHVARVIDIAAPVVFDSPLSWSTDLDGELLNLDAARLKRLVRWIDPRKRSRKPLARAANEPGTLSESFAATVASAGVIVARPDTSVALGSIQLLDVLPRELSDSVFQIAKSVTSWRFAEAILSEGTSVTLDSLRGVSELTESVLRRKLRRMIVFRLATAGMGKRLAGNPSDVTTDDGGLTPVELRGQVRLSPKLAEGVSTETEVDTMRFRGLVRRKSIYLLNPDRVALPWATSRDTIIVINDSDRETAGISEVLGLYNPHVVITARAVLGEKLSLDSNQRVVLIAGPASPMDTLLRLKALLEAHSGLVVSAVVGHPDRLELLPTNGAAFSMPVADDTDWQNLLAAPFAGVEVAGRLPKSIDLAAVGTQTILPKTRFAPLDLLTAGIDVVALTDIDAIVGTAVRIDATPGAQVSVIYRGQLVYDRGFGVLAPGERAVDPTDLYDLASLTKVTATTLAAMKLYEEGKIKLGDPIRNYVRGLAKATGALRVQDLLRHETGLRRDIPIQGDIHRTARAYYTADCRTKYCSKSAGRFTVPVADKLFFNSADQARIFAAAKQAIPNQRKRYGDLNFFLLQQVLESASGVPLDGYVDSVFYRPMGLEMGYRPLAKHGGSVAPRIAPTEYDFQWRKQRLRGFVHDEAAALQGGVAGHAGSFGSAREVAILFDMLSRGGVYGERRYLETETIATFIDSEPAATRALGFVKAPRPDEPKKGVLPVFGHTGFTGTSVWTDPERELTIAFTSNRIYRGRSNWKLQKTKVREQVQRVVYQALPD